MISAAPTVSILVPAHNAAPWLAATLESALAQTWPHTEVIVVENGSSDRTLEIARNYEPRGVRVFSLPACTAAAARNRAFTESRGNLIQYLDADDLLSPDKIAPQVAQLDPNVPVISLSALGEFQDGEDVAAARVYRSWPYIDSDAPAAWLADLLGAGGRSGYVAVHQWLTPRRLIDAAGPWNESLTVQDDGEFFSRVVLAARALRAAPQSVAYYRRHSRAISLSSGYRDSREHAVSLFRATELIAARVTAANPDATVRRTFARHFYDCALLAYPVDRATGLAAERAALQCDPSARPPRPTSRLAGWVRTLFGWRTERRLAHAVRRRARLAR